MSGMSCLTRYQMPEEFNTHLRFPDTNTRVSFKCKITNRLKVEQCRERFFTFTAVMHGTKTTAGSCVVAN